jgi:hypothetical protein
MREIADAGSIIKVKNPIAEAGKPIPKKPYKIPEQRKAKAKNNIIDIS